MSGGENEHDQLLDPTPDSTLLDRIGPPTEGEFLRFETDKTVALFEMQLAALRRLVDYSKCEIRHDIIGEWEKRELQDVEELNSDITSDAANGQHTLSETLKTQEAQQTLLAACADFPEEAVRSILHFLESVPRFFTPVDQLSQTGNFGLPYERPEGAGSDDESASLASASIPTPVQINPEFSPKIVGWYELELLGDHLARPAQPDKQDPGGLGPRFRRYFLKHHPSGDLLLRRIKTQIHLRYFEEAPEIETTGNVLGLTTETLGYDFRTALWQKNMSDFLLADNREEARRLMIEITDNILGEPANNLGQSHQIISTTPDIKLPEWEESSRFHLLQIQLHRLKMFHTASKSVTLLYNTLLALKAQK